MNNSQAKFILRSYRPDGSDAGDPAFRESLARAEHDPVLSRWLASETAADLAVVAKLKDVPVPTALLDDILAAQRIRVLPPPRTRGLRWLALAAALTLAVGLPGWHYLHTPPLAAASYARVATGFLNRPFQLDVHAKSLEDVRTWLRANHRNGDVAVPAALSSASKGDVGCRAFSWRGEDVMLLCFTLENGVPAHLFVMKSAALPGAPGREGVLYAQQGQWSTATWAEGDQAFVLATMGGTPALQALL